MKVWALKVSILYKQRQGAVHHRYKPKKPNNNKQNCPVDPSIVFDIFPIKPHCPITYS